MDIDKWGLEKMIDYHESAISGLNTLVNKLTIDLSVLISEFKTLKKSTEKLVEIIEDTKKNEKLFLEKLESIKVGYSIGFFDFIKTHLTTIAAVSVPSLGVIGTILYEIGKYLRHLPPP